VRACPSALPSRGLPADEVLPDVLDEDGGSARNVDGGILAFHPWPVAVMHPARDRAAGTLAG